jgi:hypothetical protein
MSTHKKIAFWITGGIGILAVFLLTAILLAPRLINSEAVKAWVLAEVSRRAGGKVGFERVDFALFPLPCVAIHELSLSFPEVASATVHAVTVHPELLPLLKRKVRIAKLDLQMPNLMVSLPEAGKRKLPTLSELEGAFGRFLSLLELDAPGLVVQVENGSLTLSQSGHAAFSLQGIQAHIVLPPESLKIQISCASSFWDRFSAEASITPKGLNGVGHMEVVGFRPHLLADYLFPGMALPVAESLVNLQTRFQTEGLRKWEAQVQGSIPSLTLRRGQRERIIRVAGVKGSFRLDEGKATATITELVSTDPPLRLTGSFAVDSMSPHARLEMSSGEVDIGPLREAALAMVGDQPVVQEVFRIVRAGSIPRISIQASGKSVADLEELESIVVTGSMRGGEIFVPGVALDLKEVSGEVVLSRGILSGEHLGARLGNARARAGNLKLGLAGKNAPFHLDTLVQADLAEGPLLLRRLIKNETFRKELSLISDLKGQAVGRLVLEGRGSEIKPRVDISEMHLFARYRPIPYPIVIHEGQLSYEGNKMGVTNLSGALGASSFSGLTAHLSMGKGSHLALRCGRSAFSLDELYPWLRSLEGLRKKLQEVKSMKGTLELSVMSLEGPLTRPGDWRFNGSGAVKDVVAKTSLVPGSIRVASGKIGMLPERFSFAEVQAKLMDAAVLASGDLHTDTGGLSKARFALSGKAGPEATRWLSSVSHLPPHVRVPSSFDLLRAEIVWEKGGATACKGNIAYQGGPNLSGEVILIPGELAVKNLLIQDKTSRARLDLFLKNKALDVHFSGNLTRETMAKLGSSGLFPMGWVKGDMAIHLLNDQPGLSTASGKLEGENLELPLGLPLPLTIERFSLDAEKNTIRVKSASFILKGSKTSLNGDVHFFPRGVDLDLGVSTGGIDLERLVTLFGKDKETPPQPPGGKSTGKEKGKEVKRAWDVPVTGKIRLESEYLSYGKYTWRPLRAVIGFDREGARVAVSEANLCGISTPGSVKVTSPKVTLDFRPASQEKDIDEVLYCLFGMKAYLTGTFDLNAQVAGQGTISELVPSLNGDLSFSARDGRIYRLNVLAKILSVVNVSAIFRGRLPDLTGEGLAYRSLAIKGEVKNGKFVVTEAVLDATSMEIVGRGNIDLVTKEADLLVLVAPFRTVDSALNKIPVVRNLFGGSLISIPVKVTGDLDDPKVKIFPISAVDSGILDILKNAVKLPVKLIEPVIPLGKGK